MSAQKKDEHRFRRPAGLALPLKIGGGAVGLLAILWLLLYRLGGDEKTLESQVAALRARENGRPRSALYAQAEKHVEEFRALANQPGFSKLSKQDQDFVNSSLRALKAYQEYEKALAEIPDAKSASSDEQLQRIDTSLHNLSVPQEYKLDWKDTPAVLRHTEWLEDSRALKLAVKDTLKAYQELIRDGTKVIETAADPNLPGRAGQILDRAKELPDPKQDQDKLIPDSKRITYATVFRFQPLMELHRRWKVIENQLRPLLTATQP